MERHKNSVNMKSLRLCDTAEATALLGGISLPHMRGPEIEQTSQGKNSI